MVWRVGRRVPINVYDGERPVCQCHTVIDAQRIVNAMNRRILLADLQGGEAAPPGQAESCMTCGYNFTEARKTKSKVAIVKEHVARHSKLSRRTR